MTDAEFAALETTWGGIAFIGPIPLVAVVELLFRVRALHFAGGIEFEAFDTTAVSILESFDAVYSDEPLTETMILERTNIDAAGGGTVISYPFAGSSSVGSYSAAGGGNALDDRGGVNAIFQGFEVIDTPSGFYLNGVLGWAGTYTSGSSYTGQVQTYDTGGTKLDISADLVLQSGTFPIRAVATTFDAPSIDSASLRIEATEWFPFKTTANADAWDTTTGAPINGGPSA